MINVSQSSLRVFALLGLLALSGITATPAAAQPAVDTLLRELRTAVRSGDRNAVAERIQFPIVIRLAGLRIPFTDASALLARYDDIVTTALLDTIAKATPTVGENGFAVGTNALIITQVEGRLRITEINVPPAAPGGAAAPAPGNTAPSASRSKAPARVTIRPGPGPTQFAGSLAQGGTDAYLLFVPKGRLLEVRLERVRGREALIRVVHSTTGAPLHPRTAGGARVVTGIATEGADYRIEVRRSESEDAEPLPYLVSLTLK